MSKPGIPVVLDASAAIVLFASGHCREIADAWPGSVHVLPEVVAEVEFLRNPFATTRSELRDPIDWTPVLTSGVIDVLTRTDPAAIVDFLRFALVIDDGEAAAGAAALHRRFTLVLDDRKARRVLAPEMPLRWSLDLVHHWCTATNRPGPDVATVLQAIRQRARYQPHESHPLMAWWERHIGFAPT